MNGTNLVLCLAVVLLACTGRGSSTSTVGDDKVLAHVNGTAITQGDVEEVSRTMFGTDASRMDDAAKKKLLESVVYSRAIAQAREKELTATELADLERAMRAHREQILVQQYLAKHAGAPKVSPELARRYYDENASRFGGATVRSYELASAPSLGGDSTQQAALLAALGDAAQQPDWSAWAQKLGREGKVISVRRGQGDDTVLHPKLRHWIAQVKTGETSRPTIIEGVPYVVRVTSDRVTPPKPFHEVRDEIGKMLAPEGVKEAVREVSTQVMKQAEVAYR